MGFLTNAEEKYMTIKTQGQEKRMEVKLQDFFLHELVWYYLNTGCHKLKTYTLSPNATTLRKDIGNKSKY